MSRLHRGWTPLGIVYLVLALAGLIGIVVTVAVRLSAAFRRLDATLAGGQAAAANAS